jgi:hypothetical protein
MHGIALDGHGLFMSCRFWMESVVVSVRECGPRGGKGSKGGEGIYALHEGAGACCQLGPKGSDRVFRLHPSEVSH